MSPKIHAATIQDAAEIARLCTQLGYAVAVDVMLDRLRQVLASPSHSVLVAYEHDLVLGWVTGEARVTLESGARVEITGLIVDSAVRRTGIGRLLVAGVERWARARQCNEILVRSNVTRLEPHPFYETLGYGRAKTQHAYRKVLDAL